MTTYLDLIGGMVLVIKGAFHRGTRPTSRFAVCGYVMRNRA